MNRIFILIELEAKIADEKKKKKKTICRARFWPNGGVGLSNERYRFVMNMCKYTSSGISLK
jgi:hypothetical protein